MKKILRDVTNIKMLNLIGRYKGVHELTAAHFHFSSISHKRDFKNVKIPPLFISLINSYLTSASIHFSTHFARQHDSP